MTKDEKKAFDELRQLTITNNEMIKELLITIRGDDKLGLKGLIKQQAEDEQFRKDIIKELNDIKTNYDSRFQEIHDWIKKMDVYMGLFISSKVWRFVFIVAAIVFTTILAIKGFFHKAFDWLNL
jgi:hypothetical protein